MVSAYSIGTSKRTDFVKSSSPGPGQYDNTDKKPKQILPSWKIGTEERPSWGNSQTPGPGRYDGKIQGDSTKERAPTYQFGLKPNLKPIENVPGPGTYESKLNFQTLPKYTLRPKTQQEHIFNQIAKNPGPGYYETNYSTIQDQPSSKIGNSQRTTFNIKSLSPGPGKYLGIQYKPDMPQYGFGTEDRRSPVQQNSSNQKLKLIGPGSYNVQSSIRKNIGPALTPRRNDIFAQSNQTNPGPGTYEQNQDFVKHQDPKYKIGTDQRIIFDTRNKSAIGPGQYSPKISQVKHQEPRYKIGTSNRVNFADMKSHSPGPGTYKIPQKAIEGPKHIMVSRREDIYIRKDQDSKPAPNKYDTNLNLVKEKHQDVRIGTSVRPQLTSRSLSPGPGKYQDKSKIIEGPQYTFGKQKRQDLAFKNDIPGPGNYNLKPYFADVPKYLIPDDSTKKIRLEQSPYKSTQKQQNQQSQQQQQQSTSQQK